MAISTKDSSEKLFSRLVNNTDASRAEAMAFGDLIDKGLVPKATTERIKQALLRHYCNKVSPGADNVAELTHKEFFKQFGKKY